MLATDEDLADSGRGLHAPLHDQEAGAVRNGVGHELVSVHLGSLEREEHASFHDLTRVGVKGPEGVADKRAADLAAIGGSEDLEKSEPHLSKFAFPPPSGRAAGYEWVGAMCQSVTMSWAIFCQIGAAVM